VVYTDCKTLPLGGRREGREKNMRPVLHDQRPSTKISSKKLYKIFYSVMRYFYKTVVYDKNFSHKM
jgi:hypothetical protein